VFSFVIPAQQSIHTMSNFVNAASRLADSLERLLSNFLEKDATSFKQALSELRVDLPFVAGSLEPLGLEYADRLREDVDFVMKRACDAFDGTRHISEVVKIGFHYERHELTRRQIESSLQSKVAKTVASLHSWLAIIEAKNQGRAYTQAEPNTAAELGKGRGSWPVVRTELAVAEYLGKNTGLYNNLVPLVLKGDQDGFAKFQKTFGATAIAKKITEMAGNKETDICTKAHVQKTKCYGVCVKPLLKKPPEIPQGWIPPESDGSLQDYLRHMEAE
jgi:hypothetical protein